MQLDQGTILTRIRCEKYPGMSCYGIIVTASCDIAQRKVQKYYYITAIDARQWLTTEIGYKRIFEDFIKSKSDEVDKTAKDYISSDTIKSMSVEEAMNAIDNLPQEVLQKDKNQLKKAYEEYARYAHPSLSEDSRRKIIVEFIAGGNKKRDKLLDSLKAIGRGNLVQYYYLPMNAYSNRHDVGWIGLIVDFQELGFLYRHDLERIESPGFDPFTLDFENSATTGYSKEDCSRYNQIFFMDDTNAEAENNNVEIAGLIHSPWREHLMQRFSFAFSRIGLDDITGEDYLNWAKSVDGWPFRWKKNEP